MAVSSTRMLLSPGAAVSSTATPEALMLGGTLGLMCMCRPLVVWMVAPVVTRVAPIMTNPH